MRFAVLLVSCLTVDVLFAQAGGGGSFGGGSSGGGGGGSSGGGDGMGWILFQLIRLALRYPVIGVPLLIAFIYFMYFSSKKGAEHHKTRTIRRAAPLRASQRSHTLVAELQRADPDFDVDAFLARVRIAFQRAQDSWCQQDLEPVRAFLSDGVFERFSLQIEEQQRDGWRQGMEDTQILDTDLTHVSSDRHFDTVTVTISFSSKIHRRTLEGDKKIPGSDLHKTLLVECWSFLRRRGASTAPGKGLIEGHCPNCATPIEMNATAHCSSCKSVLRSGEFDWVLAEITQGSEWQGEDTTTVPGLRALQEHDPDLNVQHLEDRASVMFWRKVAADRDGRVDPLAKVASSEFCARYEESLLASASAGCSYWGDCAVGSVKTLGILAGTSSEDTDWDRVVVEFRWDGRRRKQVKGRWHTDDRRRVRSSLFVLGRRGGQRTDIGHAVTSGHCTACGAPDDGGTGHACGYCGVVLNTGEQDWVLIDVHAGLSDAGYALRKEISHAAASDRGTPQFLTPATSGLLHWVVSTALADGVISPKEERQLERLRKRLSVPEETLQAIVSNQEAPHPRDLVEARSWLESMIELALADGQLLRSEMQLLERVAAHVGYSKYDVRQLVKERRGALYRESRAQLQSKVL